MHKQDITNLARRFNSPINMLKSKGHRMYDLLQATRELYPAITSEFKHNIDLISNGHFYDSVCLVCKCGITGRSVEYVYVGDTIDYTVVPASQYNQSDQSN